MGTQEVGIKLLGVLEEGIELLGILEEGILLLGELVAKLTTVPVKDIEDVLIRG